MSVSAHYYLRLHKFNSFYQSPMTRRWIRTWNSLPTSHQLRGNGLDNPPVSARDVVYSVPTGDIASKSVAEVTAYAIELARLRRCSGPGSPVVLLWAMSNDGSHPVGMFDLAKTMVEACG